MKYGFLLGAFLSMILSTYPMPAGAQVRFTNTAVWPAYTRGEITALELGGNHLFAAIGIGGIAVLDVTDPRSPVRVASYQLGWASDIVVKDQYAYVIGSQGDGLRVLDITYPSAPHPVATNYMVGGERLYVDGNMLYVMASSHLGIVDISNRYDPRLIEFHPVSGGGPNTIIDIADQRAYLTTYFGLLVLDVSNPTNISTVGTYFTNSPPRSLKLKDKYAFLGADRSFQVYDFRGPGEPTLVWSELPRLNGPVNLELVDDYAYVVYPEALRVFDIADPENPVLLTSHPLPESGYGFGVAVRGEHAYVGVGNLSEVHVINLNVENPVGSYSFQGYSDDVQAVGEHVYVADRSAGFRILYESGSTFAEIGRFRSGAMVMGLKIVGDLAFLAADFSGLQIVDIANKSDPVSLGTASTPGQTWGLDVANGYAYLASMGWGLAIVDVGNPRAPELVGRIGENGSVIAVRVQQGFAYVADLQRGFFIVDVRDPLNPLEVASITGNFLQGIAIDADLHHAYCLDYGRLLIVGIADPAHPVLRGTYRSGYSPYYDVYVQGTRAFLSSFYRGIEVIDIADPTAPRLLGQIKPPGTGAGVFATDDRIYLADGPTGVSIWDYAVLPRPRLSVRRGPDATAIITVSDTSGVPFVIETCTDLFRRSWQPMISVLQPGASFTFHDTTTAPNSRFYRVLQP